MGDGFGDAEHVVGADAGREERLVGVAEGGVGDQYLGLLADPLGESGGAELLKSLAGAWGGIDAVGEGHGGWWIDEFWLGLAGDGRVPVDDDVADVGEEFGGAVTAGFQSGKVRGDRRGSWWGRCRLGIGGG